ncbi:energy-coupling factor ABC transporter ATP-binding protein [Propionicicella superfundia]|uniref:energy-coupling factor ABC transporter ATP-binding protein n=1 Tax=Propionicicella superfundia TaxID=348582 RepID=UPI0004215F50|nr:ABC transporter ATP-binding protein [Propionicicella superfundia]
MIRLRDVTVAVPVPGHPAKTLLAGITADLDERRVAVIGANGSGKSTLLRLLNGLIVPTEGTVVVDGLDVAQNGRAVRAQVGFVFTDPLAQLVMATPLDDVALSLRASIRPRQERMRRARALLAERGLDGVAEQSVYALSGGERQLVALTAVLAVNPSIVVADEPTTLLDLRNRNRFLRELAALDQQVVFSTHDLEFAATADRILVIDGGRISFDGRPGPAVAHYRAAMG